MDELLVGGYNRDTIGRDSYDRIHSARPIHVHAYLYIAYQQSVNFALASR